MFQKGVNFAGDRSQGERPSQQDSFGFVPPEDLGAETDLLLLLADGMGGYAGGALASGEAVTVFAEAFFERESLDDRDRLLEALCDANERLADLIDRNPALDGMGTTFVAVLVRGDRLRWVSVGDSPFFLYRNRGLIRLNAEHSLRDALDRRARAGEISAQEAREHPQRNHLLSALTGGPIQLIDAPEEATPLRAGDLLVACSDGVLTLDETRFARALEIGKNDEAREIVRRLLEDIAARRNSRQDNATIAVIQIGDWVESPAEEGEISGSG